MTPNTCNVENVTHINYHSDFRLIIRFNSDKLPDYPWRITFSTPSTHTVDKYVASFDGENYINCKPVDTLPGAAIVFFDHHRLGCGTLGYILDMDIPDDEFPDGKMDIEIPGVETIELWPGKSDETELPAEIIVALLQMLKGFSPSIEVEENSDDNYILRITNETGSYLTPNLRASLNLAQSTGDSQYIAMSQDATTKALAEKVDKEEGKGLSTNDYTDQEKEKLAGLSNYDDTEIRKELSDKVSKKELTEAAAGALAEAKSYTDTKTTELWNNVSDVFDATSEELNSNISGGDAQTLTEAKNYTDKAISEIPTPDVSGQIERHNTSPTAHPDIRELLNTCVGLPEFNDKTYELTFTTKGGAKFIIDLPIEMMGLHYNEDTQSIEFVNADGSISSIPVSDFVKVYVGSIGSEIQVTVEGSEIRASLLNNTVSWDKLTLALQEMIQGKADRTELPTKLSQLQNDPNFVTSGTLETQLTPIKTELGGTVHLGEEIGESSTPPPIPDTGDEISEVLAHSDCTLEARVTHLERLLMEMLSGKVLIPGLQVKKLGVWGDNNLVVTGEGAPTKAPDRAGQFYVDTKNNAVYHSVGNGAVSDWKNA
jgi:hypothetical protein